MVPETDGVNSLCLNALQLCTVHEDNNPSILSNDAFSRASSTEEVFLDGKWCEVTGSNVSLFDSSTSNKIMSPTWVPSFRSNDGASLNVTPQKTLMQNIQTNMDLVENELVTLISSLNVHKDEDQDEYSPLNDDLWKIKPAVSCSTPSIGTSSNAFNNPLDFSPPPLPSRRMTSSPIYTSSLPNQDEVNLFFPIYPAISRPIQSPIPQQRAHCVSSSINTIQQNRNTRRFKPYPPIQRIPSNTDFNQSHSLLERSFLQSNQSENFLASTETGALQQYRQFLTPQSSVKNREG
ncbi:unnamed protein product [Heterobilharzia americana]|nr:unnamed protein product [Heterobilharzia americana]